MVAVTLILPISSTLMSKPQQGSDPQLKIQYLQMLVPISYCYLKVQHLTSTLKHSKIQTCFIVSIKTYPYPGSLSQLPRILPREKSSRTRLVQKLHNVVIFKLSEMFILMDPLCEDHQ